MGSRGTRNVAHSAADMVGNVVASVVARRHAESGVLCCQGPRADPCLCRAFCRRWLGCGALIERADATVPGLAGAIEFREASTPLTSFRYTRNPRGAIEGYENSPENSGPGWLPQQTPVRNLFLAGAWTSTGGQNPAIASGAAAARLAMRLAPAHAHA